MLAMSLQQKTTTQGSQLHTLLESSSNHSLPYPFQPMDVNNLDTGYNYLFRYHIFINSTFIKETLLKLSYFKCASCPVGTLCDELMRMMMMP